MTSEHVIDASRVAHGGLFYEMQARVGLVKEDQLRPIPRAFVFVLIAWAVPLTISVLEGSAFGSFSDMPFLLHLPVLSRFLVGVGLLIAMEPVAERQLAGVLRPLLSPPLLAPGAQAEAAAAVKIAVRRRTSRLAEIVCFGAACGLSVGAGYGLSAFDPTSWAFVPGSSGQSFSYTALWCIYVSSPIYFFLVVRWVWRMIIVALLLRSIAVLDLRMTATHPDGAGGIGFVSDFPNAYTLFVLALSCNLAAGIAEHLGAQTITITTYSGVMAVWLLITNGLLALPALFFTRPLGDLKQRTVDVAQARATRHRLASEYGVIDESVCGATEEEVREGNDVADPTTVFNAAQGMSTVLVRRSSLLPVSAAAVLPLFAAGATLLPLKELFQILRKLLLF